MKFAHLHEAEKVYSTGNAALVKYFSVAHPVFHEFYKNITLFERNLGETREEIFWKKFLAKFRKYRFELSTTPLPFNYPEQTAEQISSNLLDHLRFCRLQYPEHYDEAMVLVEHLTALLNRQENPLLDCIINEVCPNEVSRIAILSLMPALIPKVTQILSPNLHVSNMEVISIYQLRNTKCYDELTITCHLSLLPNYVLNSPRADEINIITYDWLKAKYSPRPSFEGSIQNAFGSAPHISLLNRPAVPDELVIPSIDWTSLSKRGLQMRAEHRDEYQTEIVDARLLFLEGNLGVFLDAEEGAKATIFDMDEIEEARVQKRHVNNIEPNMFVLLRTEGGGDYIVPIADQIMGKEAVTARESQRNWKSLLRQKVHYMSIGNVKKELTKFGSHLANEVNIRNWMSYRSIKTEDRSDFQAIMCLVGLKGESDEYWSTMCKISQSHQKAGQHIRKLLIKEACNTDMSNFEKIGKMEFQLPGKNAGSLTAFRVLDISPDNYSVPANHLGHAFTAEEDLWLE